MSEKKLKPYVREYLRERKVDPDDLPDAVLTALNGFTKDELKALNRLGKALTGQHVKPKLIVAMVH